MPKAERGPLTHTDLAVRSQTHMCVIYARPGHRPPGGALAEQPSKGPSAIPRGRSGAIRVILTICNFV